MSGAQEADNTQFSEDLDVTKQKLAQGLVELLVPLIQDLDVSVLAVRESQTELFREIDRLSNELQTFVEGSKTPSLDPYVQKLANSRRRVLGVQHQLRTVQERLDRIYAMASRRRPQGPGSAH